MVRAHRRRAAAVAAAFGISLLVGAVAAAGQLRGGAADATQTSGSALESASLASEQRLVANVAATRRLEEAAQKAERAVPQKSGEGRRIVFSESRQRVWLIGASGRVERTYPVSGSKYDNLDPGTYAVQSRTMNATSFDYTGTMKYFVRFTQGKNAPIGFHSVPRHNNGELEQTKAQLGTPLSSGCVRQWADDARALWDFAPVGTTVVVTA